MRTRLFHHPPRVHAQSVWLGTGPGECYATGDGVRDLHEVIRVSINHRWREFVVTRIDYNGELTWTWSATSRSWIEEEMQVLEIAREALEPLMVEDE